MSKIIILEGPDGAGKTTLAQKLRLEGWHYLHHGLYPKDTGKMLLKRYAMDILEPAAERVVIDRSYWSEYTYGTVMRNKDRLGRLGLALMHRLCRARGVAEIFCLPPLDTCRQNWLGKVGDYVDKRQKHTAVYQAYHWLLKHNSYVTMYDYTWANGDAYDLCHLAGAEHHMLEGGPWLPEGVVGSPTAKYLIVGEQVNLKKYWVDLPFFDLTGVSKWFYEVLWECRAEERDLAFVNAYNAHGFANDLKAVTKALPYFRNCVALGGPAAFECRLQKVPFSKVPHPNYWMRFNHKRTRDYVLKMREAIYGE